MVRSLLLIGLVACTPAADTSDPGEVCDGAFWFTDADGDGFGGPATAVFECEAPAGTIAQGLDCDDADPGVSPGATESTYDGKDNDCDGTTPDDDLDGDGFARAGDCDDADPAVRPSAIEVPYDGVDNDCDPATPDDDLDRDGAIQADDCDDAEAAIGPHATELAYDGVDNDCDPATLDDDLDQDGAGIATDCDDEDAAVGPAQLEVAYDGLDNDCSAASPDDDLDGDGFVVATDCADTDAAANPGRTEVTYDGVDNDCDPSTPDDDLDADGYANALDCDEAASDVNPGVAEVAYDGVDNDCDVATPDDDLDADGALAIDDCDDLEPAAHPGAAEITYDGLDNDCDPLTLDDDLDEDGYALAEDCDDADAARNPGKVEKCTDGVDNNCSGTVDCVTESLSAADARFEGADRELAGWGVAIADVNADGYADIAVGSRGYSSYAGGVEIVLGGPSVATLDLASADAILTGDADEMAASVAAAGDVNNDGYADLIVGAPGINCFWGSWCGGAYLVLGSATPTSGLMSAGPKLTGEYFFDQAGSFSAGLGDFDGDGYGDVAIGGPLAAGYDGATWLIRGSATPASMDLVNADATWTGEAASDGAGWIGAGGDVNGDGLADLLIGAPGNDNQGTLCGASYLVLGTPAPAGGNVADADVVITGDTSLQYVGRPPAGAGDVDADGYDDTLIVAGGVDDGPRHPDVGAAYLVLGGASPASGAISTMAAAMYMGEDTEDGFSMRAAAAGDPNGDGHADIVIGTANQDAVAMNAGAAYLVFGSPVPPSMDLSRADIRYTGEAEHDQAGFSVAGGGDVNGDGYDDVLIGAAFAMADYRGFAYLWFGSP